jgi:hypothetical protein
VGGAAGSTAVPDPGGAQNGVGGQDALKSRMAVQVLDGAMNPIREARVLLRSRGPKVDPLRGITDGEGITRMSAPPPGEYLLKIDVPGYLPARVDRLLLGRTPPVVTAVLTSRPLDYPAKPAELLPEEKPVPPEGFPGSPENKPPPAAPLTPAP